MPAKRHPEDFLEGKKEDARYVSEASILHTREVAGGSWVEVIHIFRSDVADQNVTARAGLLSSFHVCSVMAFPIPSHLPKKQPTDISSAILNKVSGADSKSLNAALAGSWITDLDESIRAAKVRPCLNLRSL